MTTPVSAAYLRISIDRTGEAVSTDRQAKRAVALASEHGLPRPMEYTEPGSTSASKPRGKNSAYARLLADVRSGRIKVVIVWDLDRLTRQPDEMEEWLKLCEQHGVRIVTMDGEVDTTSANGRLFLRIKADVSRHEIEHKAARQRDANRDRAESGRPWLAGRRAFGYLPDYSGVIESEAALVRQAFIDVQNGVSLRTIVRRWTEAGALTCQGNAWVAPGLRQLLQNPTYCGQRRYNGAIVAELQGVPKIVDADLFAAVGHILKNPDRLTSDRGGRGPLHLLSGAAQCGACDGALGYGKSTPKRPGEATYQVLRCRSCLKIARKAEPIEAWISKLVVARLSRPDAVKLFEVPTEDLKPLRKRAADLRAQRDALAADLTVDLSFAAKRDARLREELDTIERELAGRAGSSPLAAFAGTRAPADVWAGLDVDGRRGVIKALVSIKVLPVGRQGRPKPKFDGKTLEITWKLDAA